MKKQFLLTVAIMSFGFAVGQEQSESKAIAEVVSEKEIKTEIDKTDKKVKKNKETKRAKKGIQKTKAATTKTRRYYINASGQKSYIE